MDERKKLRYQLMGLFYLGVVVLMSITDRMTIDTSVVLLFLWLLFINLLGWYLNRRLRKRQDGVVEEGLGEAPSSDTEHTARDVFDPGD